MSIFGSRPLNPRPISRRPSSWPGSVQRSTFKKPASKPKPSLFSALESLGIKRPAVKQEPKPQSKPQHQGLFGEKGYRTFAQLREFARKAPYEPLPGTTKKLSKKERVAFIKDLQERSKQIGQSYGLSAKKYLEVILPKMKKELIYMKLRTKQDFDKKKLLQRKIMMYDKWREGI